MVPSDIPNPPVIPGGLEALKTVKASGDVNRDSNTSKGVWMNRG